MSSAHQVVFDPAPFLADFREESAELLRTVDALLMQVEREPARLDTLRDLFLSIHTIKGGASMLRLAEVSELAHALEDVLARLQKDARPVDRATLDLLFKTADLLRELTMQETPGQGEPGARAAALAATLRARASAPDSGWQPAPPPDRAVPPTVEQIPADQPAPAEPCVLLVEDSPTVRMLVTMLLSRAGIRVEAVADGREALALARERAFSLVITSVEIRGLRGLELAAALRESPSCRDLPIIVMSSDDDPEHRRQAFRTGVQAYIRKGSFDRWRLLETVRELLPRGAETA